MKFTVGIYEIEISAKTNGARAEFNDQDTMSFMNQLSMWMDDAARYKNFESRGDRFDFTPAERDVSKRCAGLLKDESTKIFEQLLAYGCYNR